ncbi:cupin domain-containing protein [Streptomyces humi]|uniref:cupin domain-containing protein n=1 Tax=Streptomyces humi TaxID=1428620 RepID=UPI001F0A5CE6|nr:cupin domain-containing protein [Streptomyces humi]
MEPELLDDRGEVGAFLGVQAAQRQGQVAVSGQAQVSGGRGDDPQGATVPGEQVPQRLEASGLIEGPLVPAGLGRAGLSVSALTEGPVEGRVRVVSADAVTPLWAGEKGGEARLMLTTSGPAPVEVWRWRLEPGEEYPSHPHQTGVVETVSVTAGQMVLVVDGTEHAVAAGQTATFDADAPHTYRGSGAGTCHLIMTVHIPPGPGSAA